MTLSGGSMSGMLESAFTGAYTCSQDGHGQVSATITPSGESPFVLPIYVNASKDVMISSQVQPGDNTHELLIFVRATTSTPTISDAKGLWRVADFETPTALSLNFNGNSEVTSINGGDSFNAKLQSLVLGSDHFFTAKFGQDVTGTFAFPGGGALNVTVEQPDGQHMKSFIVNASQNLAISLETGDSNELVLVLKAPAATSTQREFGLISQPIMGGRRILWASDTGRKLQSTTDFIMWDDVSNTMGEHSSDVTTTGQPSTFFRLIEVPQ